MSRPRVTENPAKLHITVDASILETLALIARASKVGVPPRNEVIRVAINEFIDARMKDPVIRSFVESFRKSPIKLVPEQEAHFMATSKDVRSR